MSNEQNDLSYLLSSYDEIIASLQQQIDVYRTEHEFLKSELLRVVSDNEQLNDVLNNELRGKLNSVSAKHNYFEEESIKNLRNQLEIHLVERKQLFELYELSKEQIQNLQDELHKERENKPPSNSVLQAKVESLSFELKFEKSCRDEESMRVKKFETEAAKLRVLLHNKETTISELGERITLVETTCGKLRQELTLANTTLECVMKTRDELEALAEDRNRKALEFQRRTVEAKAKVQEALDVAEHAVAERDSLQESMKHVIEEAGLRLRMEMESLRKKHNDKLLKVLREIRDLENQLKLRDRELDEMRLQCKQLHQQEAKPLLDTHSTDIQQQMIQQSEHERTNRQIGGLVADREKLMDELDAYREVIMQLEGQVRNCRCAYLRNKLKWMKGSKARELSKLEHELSAQLALNAKWTEEMTLLTQQLEDKIECGMKKAKHLKTENKILRTRLHLDGNQLKC